MKKEEKERKERQSPALGVDYNDYEYLPEEVARRRARERNAAFVLWLVGVGAFTTAFLFGR